ncbi:MAG: flagellar biosynthesis protein FlgD [Rhodopseudomonas sp.]|nr:flagellar biosynthesis protein FlgD [Rhodopseudomonas sp.]
MTISSVSSAYTTASTSTTSSSASSVSSTLSTSDFLTLIVSELQNQNPLDPTDTTQFMNQLVSYASYDQQQTMNTNLSALVTSMNSMLAGNGLGYIGQTVEAKGDTTTLQNGSASWGYSLSSEAASTTITVSDQDGNTVWTGSGETSSGSHTFTWDGTTSSGGTAPDGDYTVSVAATNASGTSVLDYTTVIGKVTGIDNTSGTTQLVVGDTTVPLANVINVKS